MAMADYKKRKIVELFYAFLLPVTLLSVIGSGPLFAVFLGVLLYLVTLNKYELSIVLMIAFPHIVGMIRGLIGINIPASAFLFIIVICLLNVEIKYLNSVRVRYLVLYSLFLFFVFVLLYYSGFPSNKGASKLVDVLLTIICTSTGFSILITYGNVNLKKVGVGFLFVACLYLWLSYTIFLYPRPTNYLDFMSFRDYTMQLAHMELPNVSYHHLGYCGFYFISLLLAEEKSKFCKWDIVPIFIAIWIALYSGGRQIIIGIAVMIVIWAFLRGERRSFSNICIAATVLLLAWFAISNLELFADLSDQSTSSDKKINRNWDYPIQQIISNPTMGVGLGNYFNPETGESYPHNIILEILCEFGFFGLFIITFFTFVAYVNSKPLSRKIIFNKRKGIMIIFPYLLHCFISGSLGTNVQVFVIFFAILASAGFYNNRTLKAYLYNETKKVS